MWQKVSKALKTSFNKLPFSLECQPAVPRVEAKAEPQLIID